MDDGRFPSSRENPRGFPADRPPRPSPPEPRPAPSVLLDRFRAMVRLREEEIRGGEEDEDELSPTLTTAEIVQLYEEVLGELMFNSKPIITELTMIAGDHREHAEGIADAICSRILKVPVDHKLPSLYLLDSIVKNIGREYVRHFAPRLPKVFCEAYNEVNSSLRPAMRHLFGTWSQVFHPSVLRQIEDELHFSTPLNQRSTSLADRHSESPSPRPSHGIHVNPKYLEARRQLEHSAAMHVMGSHTDVDTVDIEGGQIGRKTSENPRGRVGASPKLHDVQHLREVSSSLQVYGHRSSNQYREYDCDHNEVLPSRREIARSGSPRTASVRASSMVGDEATLPHLKSRGSRPSSPPRVGLRRSISPVDDRFRTDISPGRVERPSPTHSGFGQGRLTDQNDWSERRWHTDEGAQQRESSIGYNLSNGHTKERTRELIDAYGSYRETYDFHEKHPKVQRVDVNGFSNEATTRNWQSSEEEEYIWEDMSPTLADQSNRNRLQPFGSFNGRPAINRSDDRPLEPDFRRVNWRDLASRPPVDDDRIPALSSDLGSMTKKYLDIGGSRNDSLLHYHSASHLQEPRKFPYVFSPYSHQILSPRTIPSPGQTFPGPNDNFPDADIPFRRLPIIHTGNLNVDTPAIGRHFTHRPYSPPRAPPPIHPQLKHQQLPLLPLPPTQKQYRNSYDFTEGSKPVINQGPNSSLPFTWQQYDASDKKSSTFTKPLQLPYPPYQHPGSQEQSTTRVQSQEGHGSFISRAQPQLLSHMPQPLNHVQTQGQGVVVASGSSNTLSGLPSSVGMQSMPDTTLHVRGGVLPPLPPGPPPPSQQGSSIISSSPASAFSGLIGTLMAQGLISLAPPGQSQVPHSDSVGVEFNVELLKVRHESAIRALYSDLPRQCTTCGLRFKCQEEHSSHMDWHVTKNRISKNRKQKPSRKWFVSAKEWLSGAEILGTDVVPGFLPTEVVAEKKEDKEMAVPADEDQNMCALCGELFEDFYSDETEEWMYKGAVYMNTPNGNTEGLDRSQFGPIVHVKCRSESAEDIG